MPVASTNSQILLTPAIPVTREYHQSEIATYLKCGKMWEFRYVLGIKTPPSGSLTVGRSVDSAITHNLVQKIKSGRDVPDQEVIDVCATEFEKEAVETEWAEDEKPGEEKDSAIQCVKAHHEFIAPQIDPATVQEKFILQTDAGYNLGGTIDLVEKNGIVADSKTAGKKYNEESIAKAIQPAVYDFAYESLTGKKSTGFRYDVMIKPTKTQPARIQQVNAQVTDGDRLWLFETIGAVDKAIRAGVALPAPDLPGAWWCSKKFCGYWGICKGKNK